MSDVSLGDLIPDVSYPVSDGARDPKWAIRVFLGIFLIGGGLAWWLASDEAATASVTLSAPKALSLRLDQQPLEPNRLADLDGRGDSNLFTFRLAPGRYILTARGINGQVQDYSLTINRPDERPVWMLSDDGRLKRLDVRGAAK